MNIEILEFYPLEKDDRKEVLEGKKINCVNIIFKIMNKYDFYDFEKAEQLRSEHCKKGTDLLKRFYNAKQNGNQKDIERARKALIKHRAYSEQMKEWAEEARFYWF